VRLGEAKTSIFPGDLDSEGTQLGQSTEDGVGDLAAAIDLIWIHLAFQEGLEALEKGIPLILVLLRLPRKGQDGVKAGASQKEGTAETGARSGLHAGFLRQLEGGAFFRGHLRGV